MLLPDFIPGVFFESKVYSFFVKAVRQHLAKVSR
jgi:hypothetical protein